MGRLWGSAVLVAMPVIWYFVHSSADGGSATSLRSIQDSLYTFLFSIAFTLVLLLLRDQASKADSAAEQLIKSEANKAAADAVERERLRIGALIHDRVLTALIVAGKAKAPAEVSSSRELAKLAISALHDESEPGAKTETSETSETSVIGLFEDIRKQFAESGFEIDEADASLIALPSNVAQAFLEATRQAVTNSMQHAGPNVNRAIILRGSPKGFKIVVKDDGRGFRPSRVSRSRLGIRISIIERIESAGGKAYIDSRPGGGCSIILTWVSR
jgi:signal transduction histidine kinase